MGLNLNGTADYPGSVDGNCTHLNTMNPGTCAWAALEISRTWWVNTTVSIDQTGTKMVLSAVLPLEVRAVLGRDSTPVVTGSAYGYGSIPMLSVVNRDTRLPVLPWNTSSALNPPPSPLILV